MKLRPFVSVWGLLLAWAIVFSPQLRADDDPVVVSYRANQKALLEGEYAKKLFALPEWGAFRDAFTSACDEGLTKELTREKIQNRLPAPIVDDIVKLVDKGISTRKAFEAYAKHVQAIVFELREDFDDEDIDEQLDKIQRAMAGQTKDLDLDFDGYLAIVLDVNPRPWLSVLKYFKEDRDYKFLRNETDGDFVLDFDFEFHGKEIEFCCAGLKLDAGFYALVFADSDDILARCDALKRSGSLTKDLTVAKKEFIVERATFRFLDRVQQRFASAGGSDLLGKIQRFSSTYTETGGVCQCVVTLEMSSEQDAKSIRDIVAGFIALAQLQTSSDDEKSINGFLASIVVETRGGTVTMIMKEHPDIWKLTSLVLKKATEDMNKRKN